MEEEKKVVEATPAAQPWGKADTWAIVSLALGAFAIVGCYSFGAALVIAILAFVFNKKFAAEAVRCAKVARAGKIVSTIAIIVAAIGAVVSITVAIVTGVMAAIATAEAAGAMVVLF